jgi:hypothetical protein
MNDTDSTENGEPATARTVILPDLKFRCKIDHIGSCDLNLSCSGDFR